MQFNMSKGFDSNLSVDYGIIYFENGFDGSKLCLIDPEEKVAFLIDNLLRSFQIFMLGGQQLIFKEILEKKIKSVNKEKKLILTSFKTIIRIN